VLRLWGSWSFKRTRDDSYEMGRETVFIYCGVKGKGDSAGVGEGERLRGPIYPIDHVLKSDSQTFTSKKLMNDPERPCERFHSNGWQRDRA